MIANPDYKGKWSPRKIPNPDFFEDPSPHKMTPIGAIGFELWTLSNDIYFDNILITDNEKEATHIFDSVSLKNGLIVRLRVQSEGVFWVDELRRILTTF